MLEVINQDYMRTARSKGLSECVIVTKHGLRNAMLPVLTVVGVIVGRILAGSFIVETIFNIPGVGRVGVTAVLQRDYPVILGITIVAGAVVMVVNIITDFVYVLVDPRVSLTGEPGA